MFVLHDAARRGKIRLRDYDFDAGTLFAGDVARMVFGPVRRIAGGWRREVTLQCGDGAELRLVLTAPTREAVELAGAAGRVAA